MYQTISIILAGGYGSRFGQKIPKQYSTLNGMDILENTINNFSSHPKIDAIQVVIGKDHEQYYKNYNNSKLLLPVFGGDRRQDSVYHGLKAIEKYSPKLVLIHDGVRPFVSHELIDKIINNLRAGSAVIPILHLTDTAIKLNALEGVNQYLDKIYRVQTPQGFYFSEILKCYRLEKNSLENFSDDSALAHKYNIFIKVVSGEENNIKITYKEEVNV